MHPTLFGEHALVRTWGRIGAPGRRKIVTFSELDAAKRAFNRLEASKRQRGYRDVQRDGARLTTLELAAPFAPTH
jgi:predicted DNA-binding WGR domain protein